MNSLSTTLRLRLRLPQDAFGYLDEFDRSTPVVGYERVSSRQQGRKETLKRRKCWLEAQLGTRGFSVPSVYGEVVHGFSLHRGLSCKDERLSLLAAIDEARKLDGIVVTSSWDRFLRHEHVKDLLSQPLPTTLDGKAARLPTKEEFDELLSWAGDVPLVTLLDPTADEREVKLFEQRLQPKASRSLNEAERKALLFDQAKHLRSREMSYRKIAQVLELETGNSVSPATIRNWLTSAC